MDKEELKKQLLKVELELEEYKMLGEKRTKKRYKVYGVIPEEFIR